MEVSFSLRNRGLVVPSHLVSSFLSMMYIAKEESLIAKAGKRFEIQYFIENEGRLRLGSSSSYTFGQIKILMRRFGDKSRLVLDSYSDEDLQAGLSELSKNMYLSEESGLVGDLDYLFIRPLINNLYGGRPYVPFGKIFKALNGLIHNDKLSTEDIFVDNIMKEIVESGYTQGYRHKGVIELIHSDLNYSINYTAGHLESVIIGKSDDIVFVMKDESKIHGYDKIDITCGLYAEDSILMPREFRHVSNLIPKFVEELGHICE